MPTSIIDIQVGDEHFKEFIALFDGYKSSLAQLPNAWQNVNKATGDNAATVEDLAAAMLTQNHLLRDSFDSHKSIAKEVARVDRAYDSIGKKMESMRKSAVKVTAELAKWGFAIAGIGGGAGIFGIDKLAGSAFTISKDARGLGADPGAMQAFGVNYQGLLNSPTSTLSRVANLQADMSKWGSLMAAGINVGEIQRDDPVQLSQRAVEAAKRAWDQAGPNNRNSQWMQAHGLDQIFSLEEWKRIGGTSRDQLSKTEERQAADADRLRLPPETLQALINWPGAPSP